MVDFVSFLASPKVWCFDRIQQLIFSEKNFRIWFACLAKSKAFWTHWEIFETQLYDGYTTNKRLAKLSGLSVRQENEIKERKSHITYSEWWILVLPHVNLQLSSMTKRDSKNVLWRRRTSSQSPEIIHRGFATSSSRCYLGGKSTFQPVVVCFLTLIYHLGFVWAYKIRFWRSPLWETLLLNVL